MKYDPQLSQKTQKTRTTRKGLMMSPAYKQLVEMVDNPERQLEDQVWSVLDYGAGKCELGNWLTESDYPYIVETFEPHPAEGVDPLYSFLGQIDSEFEIVVCDYVLNVVKEATRFEIMQNIADFLTVDGLAIVGTRSRLDLSVNSEVKAYDDGFILPSGQFQACVDEEKIKHYAVAVGLQIIECRRIGDNTLALLRHLPS